MSVSAAILLDTCALIWLANGSEMKKSALKAILSAGQADAIFVSPVSAWEIGVLSRAADGRPALEFLPDAKTWYARAMRGPGIRPAAFTPEIAIESAQLPGILHADPGDRLIIATARHLGLPVVTRDKKIRAYADKGHVSVIAC